MALQFLIFRSDSLIAVDNTAISQLSLSGLAANIGQISFSKDSGKLQYNDRPPTPVEFTDPSPYQPYINTWMTAAAELVPPLQLTQAKQVKKDFVDAIFQHKRRLPYTYGGKVYEASDEAVMNMTAAMVSGTSGDTGSLVGSINTALTSIVNQTNNVVAIINSNVAQNNSSAISVNDWSLRNNSNWSYIGWTYGSVVGGPGNHSYLYSDTNFYSVGYGGFLAHSNAANLSSVAVAAGGGSMSWQPIGYTDPISIAGSELSGALGGIVARRNALNNNRVDKQAAINALTTIAQVTAYDATTGWSF